LLNFDQASEGAMNSLLKVLEEPSSRAILILTAETPEALRRTIVSRCEVFRLRPLSLNQLAEYLEQTHHAAAQAAQLLSHLSSGRPGYALKMLTEPKLLDQRRQWIGDLLTLLPASRRERFEYAARVTDTSHSRGRVETYEARATLREMFLNWLSFWSDVMLCTANVSVPLVNLDYEEAITRIAAPLDLVSARRVVLAIERSLQQLDANLTPRLVTEVLLLDWPSISSA
jgi:DNA polymerase-3 subunit delta'